VRAAGGPDGLRLHDLRHVYACALIAAGESVKVVQTRTGHASSAVTLDVYGHLWPDSDEKTRSAVDAYLSAAEAQDHADSLRTAPASVQVKGTRGNSLEHTAQVSERSPVCPVTQRIPLDAAANLSRAWLPTGTTCRRRADPSIHASQGRAATDGARAACHLRVPHHGSPGPTSASGRAVAKAPHRSRPGMATGPAIACSSSLAGMPSANGSGPVRA
jgi:hypothetical protein